MEVEVERREEKVVEGKIGWRVGRHRRSLELLEMNAMVLVGRRVRFCSFKFQFLGFKMHIVCLCE
jgi:hypothetical protein